MVANRKYIIYPAALLLVVIVGYFPVAFQLGALKNDILGLDLPVKYFISQRLHQGEFPFWFYSWGVGFPLGHIFTWSVNNPLNLFFTLFFRYDVYTLHLEFIFYLYASAMGMFVLSRSLLRLSDNVSLLTASMYVLSGITLTGGQFMAYVAAVGILPWVYYAFIKVLRKPDTVNALFFGFAFFLLCSWTYPGTTIICLYTLAAWLVCWIIIYRKEKEISKVIFSLALSVLLACLLAAPLIYSSIVISPDFARSHGMKNEELNVGYLDPLGCLSLILALSGSINAKIGTVALFQNIFIGFIPLVIAIAGLSASAFRRKFKKPYILLFGSGLIFLLISFGSAFFLKPMLNSILPGFNLFRFPSYFRLFFSISVILAIGLCLEYAKQQVQVNEGFRKMLVRACLTVMLLAAAVLLYSVDMHQLSAVFARLDITRLSDLKRIAQSGSSLLVMEFGLTIIIGSLLIVWAKTNWKRISWLIMADLIVNAWIMLPVYVVSSYPVSEVRQINRISVNRDIPPVKVNNALGVVIDKNGHSWNSLNVYANQVSAAEQYIGPLNLISFSAVKDNIGRLPVKQEVIFIRDSSVARSASVEMLNNTFRKNSFSARVTVDKPVDLSLFQLNYPGWKAYIDKREVNIADKGDGLLTISMIPGVHEVEFVFRDDLLYALTIAYIAILIVLLVYLAGCFIRSWYRH